MKALNQVQVAKKGKQAHEDNHYNSKLRYDLSFDVAMEENKAGTGQYKTQGRAGCHSPAGVGRTITHDIIGK